MNIKTFLPIILAAIGGLAWVVSPISTPLLAPGASILLVFAIALATTARGRFITALTYYLIGSVSMPGAIQSFFGSEHFTFAYIALFATSTLLAAPWVLAKNGRGVLLAVALTALPPIGLIGWLSPLSASGVFFPGMRWIGLVFMLVVMGLLPNALSRYLTKTILFCLLFVAILSNMSYRAPPSPVGWIGVNTNVMPTGTALGSIQNNQSIIQSAVTQGGGAHVVVLPEAVIDRWLHGTQQQFVNAVPINQLWLLGARTAQHNSVAEITDKHAGLVLNAAALLLGGNWLPFVRGSLSPTWWQDVFVLNGQRVWISICVEQVLPWTWLEGMYQHPSVILAISNQWWAKRGSSAPQIQFDSVTAWARLLNVPVISAINLKSNN
jgi:hypothetical protein